MKMRFLAVGMMFAVAGLGAATARADITPDPVGFCASNSSSSNCSVGVGIGGDTIPVGQTSFYMMKTGNEALSDNPWYLLLAVPEGLGGAPTLSSSDFTQVGSTVAYWPFLPSTTGSIYEFAGGLTGDSSMRASNLFGANEQAAFGGTPTYFEIYRYEFTPGFQGAFTFYEFTVGGSGLVAGTFLAASGGSNPFSTPYTTTGLVQAPDGGVTLMMLGGVLVGLAALRRRFRV